MSPTPALKSLLLKVLLQDPHALLFSSVAKKEKVKHYVCVGFFWLNLGIYNVALPAPSFLLPLITDLDISAVCLNFYFERLP